MALFKRKDRDGVLLNVTPHGVIVGHLGPLGGRPLRVESLTELKFDPVGSVEAWINEHFPDRGALYVPGFCGFYPADLVLDREMVSGRKLADRTFIPSLISQRKKSPPVAEWTSALLNPTTGVSFEDDPTTRPALLFGVPWTEVRAEQERLRGWGVRPRRLEVGTLAVLGGLTHYQQFAGKNVLTAVCEIGTHQTKLYFLAKDGIHTAAPLPHGLLSIEEAAMKELAAADVAEARKGLETPSESLRSHARRLIRILSRHLRPAIDAFEMQTGQRIGGLHCAHLPSNLSWLEESLAETVDLEFIRPDLIAWGAATGIEFAEGLTPHPSFFQALCLIAQLAPTA